MPHAAILFDCDGVLVDSEVVGLEDSAAFLNDRGFEWTTEDLIRRFTGMRQDAFADGLRAAYDEEVLGRASTDEEFAALLVGVIAARRASRHEMRLVDGAEAAVAAARASGAKLAVASSSAQHFLDDKIDRYGLRAAFGEHVYSADYVAHGKPAPDIFVFAARKLGVPTSDCLVIEDSGHGVAAGVAAGCEVWGFLGGGHVLDGHAARLTHAGAARLVADHAELAGSFTVA